MTLDGKRVLVTGGTGSLGQVLVRRLLSGAAGKPAKIVVLSRDEAKQHAMRLAFLERRVTTALTASLMLALHDARTPLEKVRALSRRWFLELSARELEASFALGMPHANGLLSVAGDVLHSALRGLGESARADAGWVNALNETHLLAAAAAGEALSRRHLSQRWPEAPTQLAEVIVRMLR